MATISDALAAYRICAQAEGKSPKTIRWIMSSVTYFGEYLGANQDVSGKVKAAAEEQVDDRR